MVGCDKDPLMKTMHLCTSCNCPLMPPAWGLKVAAITMLKHSNDFVLAVTCLRIMCLSFICLLVPLSLCLTVCPSISLSFYLYACLFFVCLSVYLIIRLSVYMSICLSVYLSVGLSVYLSTSYLDGLIRGRGRAKRGPKTTLA